MTLVNKLANFFLAGSPVRDILNAWLDLRGDNFNYTQEQGQAKKAITTPALFSTLAALTSPQRLAMASGDLPANVADLHSDPGTAMKLYTLTVIHSILQTRFPTSLASIRKADDILVKDTQYCVEDFNRGWMILKALWQSTRSGRKGLNSPPVRKMAVLPALSPFYLQSTDRYTAVDPSTGRKVDADPKTMAQIHRLMTLRGNIVRTENGWAVETVEEEETAFEQLLNSEEFDGEELSEEQKLYEIERRIDACFNNLEELHHESNRNGRLNSAQYLKTLPADLRERIERSSRPLLTLKEQKLLYPLLGQYYKISRPTSAKDRYKRKKQKASTPAIPYRPWETHPASTTAKAPTPLDKVIDKAQAEEGIIQNDGQNERQATDAQRETFWELQEEMITDGATCPSYQDSCELLDIDLDTRQILKGSKDYPMCYKPWQPIGQYLLILPDFSQ